MKFLLVTGLLVFALLLLYRYARPYLAIARRIFQIFREIRRLQASQADAPDSNKSAANAKQLRDERLVRCASCGAWLPASRSVVLPRSQTLNYCSHACMERAASRVR